MKRCPNCNQIFTEDNMFCLNDGTSLLLLSETGRNPTVFPTSGEMPTQFIQHPPAVSPNPSNDTSKWLYLIIGVLATALLAITAFLFIAPKNNNKIETANTNTVETKAKAEQMEGELPINDQTSRPANTPISSVQPTVNPNLTPNGNWRGDWNSKTTYFTATASFTETGGKVSGQIVWTLQRTSNPKKADKVGLSATEYVQGIFNPATRMVNLKGFRKDDPNSLVILDKYNLSLAENNQVLSGRSINGSFVLKR